MFSSGGRLQFSFGSKSMNDKTYLLSGIKTANSTRGCSQNYGPLLVTDYITAPDILGYHNWDPNFAIY